MFTDAQQRIIQSVYSGTAIFYYNTNVDLTDVQIEACSKILQNAFPEDNYNYEQLHLIFNSEKSPRTFVFFQTFEKKWGLETIYLERIGEEFPTKQQILDKIEFSDYNANISKRPLAFCMKSLSSQIIPVIHNQKKNSVSEKQIIDFLNKYATNEI